MNRTTPENSERMTKKQPPLVIRFLVGTLRFCLPVAVLGGAIYGASLLMGSRTRPPMRDIEARATLVETMVPTLTDDRAIITGYGTVEAHRRLELQPQVGGKVAKVNAALVPGGLVSTDDVLVDIESRDYELAVEQRMADVAQAEVALQIAEANSLVAEREWALLGEEVETTELGEKLALKEPQRLEAQAMLTAALGRLQLANLDLERTRMTAPFNALVLADSVELGQVIGMNSRIATLVGTDEFEVIASVPIGKLDWITIDPENPERNSTAGITLELGDGRRIERTARVARLGGEVERAGRLAKVILLIDDPLDLEGTGERGRLLLGSYVRIDIEGPEIRDVYELPRSIVHENDTIWVMNAENELAIRPLEVVVGRIDSVLARVSLGPGESIITSPLGVALPGMPLERIGATEDAPTDGGVDS